IFVWFFCRIEVGESEFVPLLGKTGKEISNTDILAPGPEFKGPQFEILQEGRHFRNPYNWHWPKPMKATVIEKGHVGVVIRRWGEPLEEGQVVVRNDRQKGILEGQYNPGRYYLNLWEYDVEIHSMVKIEPGFMGVVTRLVGAEAENPNVFVVKKGERGTQPDLLPPGTFPGYSNPYVFMVTPIDVRSQKFEMGREYTITFPSKYGFDIRVEGTIEWAPDIAKLPELFVKYVDEQDLQESGGMNNIQRKVILPYARSYFRMIGAQYRAVDYMTGAPRIRVQNEVLRRLRESCAEQGIEIRAFVIRATEPPKRIREQYERRGMARVEIKQFTEEIKMEIGNVVMEGAQPELRPDGKVVLDERGNPRLVGGKPKMDPDGKPLHEGGRLARAIEERRRDRESKLGEVRGTIVELVRDAERYQKVEVTKAEKDLAVARINLEAADDTAAQTLAKGKAEAEVTVMKHQAEAEGVKAKISAFKTGEKYAEYQLIRKFSPGIRRILSNTEGLFARLFERFAKMGASKETKKD
ncbi:MAG: hypothetical protein KAU28_05570, partial [Phycisphaerae bacterium]|nr:hypothetical protein [Phycisphaerae bacterium]